MVLTRRGTGGLGRKGGRATAKMDLLDPSRRWRAVDKGLKENMKTSLFSV